MLLAGLLVWPADLTITTPSPLANGRDGRAYSQTLTAAGGTQPYTWALSAGSLPEGLALSPEGVVSGTPSKPRGAVFTVRCRDDAGAVAETKFRITIAPRGTALRGNLGGGASIR